MAAQDSISEARTVVMKAFSDLETKLEDTERVSASLSARVASLEPELAAVRQNIDLLQGRLAFSDHRIRELSSTLDIQRTARQFADEGRKRVEDALRQQAAEMGPNIPPGTSDNPPNVAGAPDGPAGGSGGPSVSALAYRDFPGSSNCIPCPPGEHPTEPPSRRARMSITAQGVSQRVISKMKRKSARDPSPHKWAAAIDIPTHIIECTHRDGDHSPVLVKTYSKCHRAYWLACEQSNNPL
ncbi:hypothetical protein DFH09DRAFT_1335148 [Mycena vulgaris]|nr:hypothetical protein DFH09DRAFT_1335148 [Mycena vulgaris]